MWKENKPWFDNMQQFQPHIYSYQGYINLDNALNLRRRTHNKQLKALKKPAMFVELTVHSVISEPVLAQNKTA